MELQKYMKLSEIELPSNRKFGFFFTAVFFISAVYSYYVQSNAWPYIHGGLGLAFLVITIVREDVLLPLNKIWMSFGLLLGIIISPIVMGVIFFGIFTPIAILMRLMGRDELRLHFNKKTSHWIRRDDKTQSIYFENQF